MADSSFLKYNLTISSFKREVWAIDEITDKAVFETIMESYVLPAHLLLLAPFFLPSFRLSTFYAPILSPLLAY